MLSPPLVYHRSPDTMTSAQNRHVRRWLLIFVAIAWTNLAGLLPALFAEETLTPIASINLLLTNRAITVQAIVSAVREPTSGPYIVSLTESNATVPLVYWPDMQSELATKVKVGNLIRAKVKASLYRDRPKLRISGPEAIDLVSAAPGASASTNSPTAAIASPSAATAAPTSPAAKQTVIGRIKEDWVGRPWSFPVPSLAATTATRAIG